MFFIGFQQILCFFHSPRPLLVIAEMWLCIEIYAIRSKVLDILGDE